MELSTSMELKSISSRFQSEADCIEAIIAMKWPNGFVCPRCAYTECTRLSTRHIPLFECGKCGYQASPLVGTIFERTHLPLVKWFQALELFLLPDGISALRLSQVIQVTYKTAWLMLHKIRHTLGEWDAKVLLSGEVKVCRDQYGTDTRRFHPADQPYATAVVTGCTVTETGEPERVKIQLIPHKRGGEQQADRSELEAFINKHVDGQHTSTKRWFPFVYRMYLPLRKVVRQARDSIRRTYVALGTTHLQAYLNEYTVRRYLRMICSEEEMCQNLLQMCLSIPAIPYRQLIAHGLNARQRKPFLAAVA
ncbi:IS1595 family transposase [Paenibacillus barengoltzii]|uniref:IS1595 family transposase n=1 Tax=Paenibacillus barengoltzii TaxID=343517 RepID=UPI002DB90107|nr:IS1595 family transposase [Paenibacillus barengoltzii]MEC2343365.1 IS1595 family transposase [Paenibacillus barengoltzii]